MAASKVLENEVDESRNKKLVDDFIKEVGESKWQN
jgi:F-type H+-transporting ATPase subunit b